MDLIKEINEKYMALESEIDQKLDKVHAEELKLERENEKLAKISIHPPPPKVLSYEEALLRNTNTLKSLELAKARLRSRITYSPVEKLLQQALDNYRKELVSLQAKNEVANEAAEEQNLYELVMQNVFEASGKGSDKKQSLAHMKL
ncbi:uncharacterized protein LOC117582463 [Drosophila guanche]|uniref:Uncharacterized protein n=1 Tax=Drosophila guanche TaxID=7266 RepID=A0A3B0K6K5_DROGU|nr:uncharacterized protein LOC117582463 [Drosophila guanche]SPP79118.1 Hypothetical predicted protein [Drosophila guanche]